MFVVEQVTVIGGLLVGLIFNRAWGVIIQEDGAPKPTDEQRGWREILLAASLPGTIFALLKVAAERVLAEGTRKATGDLARRGRSAARQPGPTTIRPRHLRPAGV